MNDLYLSKTESTTDSDFKKNNAQIVSTLKSDLQSEKSRHDKKKGHDIISIISSFEDENSNKINAQINKVNDDELNQKINQKTDFETLSDSFELILQKKLGKIILDKK